MSRVPVALAVLILKQSGYDVKPATLRKWVERGHITRGSGGYSIEEIRQYIERREAGTRRAKCCE
jgi:hypothetical protein